MPDWFYRTVGRPVLFRLPVPLARDVSLGFLGQLARFPGGGNVIDLLGHMRPDPRLRTSVLGINFPSPVGLGPWLDVRATALPALARFGVGFLEVGPVTLAVRPAVRLIERLTDREALRIHEPPESLSLATVSARLAEIRSSGVPVMVRTGAAEDAATVVDELAPLAHLFSLSTLRQAADEGWAATRWADHVGAVLNAARSAGPQRPVLLMVPSDALAGKKDALIETALAIGVAGLHVDGSVSAGPDGRQVGLASRAPSVATVRRLRQRYGRDLPLVAAGGIHQPIHARELLDAGADLIQVDTGLIYTGPGLPKRINEAILFDRTRDEAPEPPQRPAEMSWFWLALMGGGMLFGSLLALVFAATRVVLPYDEAFVGMTRAEINAVNPRLLVFMAHDRVSLAGAMAAAGMLYLGLSLGGVRRGMHWAQLAVFGSAFFGFASFFLFLGFGYLDTLHAFVTACMLQLLLFGVHARLGRYTPLEPPDETSHRAWQAAQWGQLLLVIHGCLLLAAGVVICGIGVTTVFVPEDLAYLRTTVAALEAANPRLVPLVAHDRATLGGMLLATGLAFLLVPLWGFRAGAGWVWWTLLLAALPAYGAGIGVHYAVGYTDWIHLLPAFAVLGIFLTGLMLAGPFLLRPSAYTSFVAREPHEEHSSHW